LRGIQIRVVGCSICLLLAGSQDPTTATLKSEAEEVHPMPLPRIVSFDFRISTTLVM